LDKIILAEKPHLAIQGEGVTTNKKMLLLRVFGCPLRCSDCDSKQSWSDQNAEYDQKSFYKMIKKNLKKFNTNHILLTGGEPGIYISFLTEFFQEYQNDTEWKWDIETSGFYDLTELYAWESDIQFNFSPKIGALPPEKPYEIEGLKNLPMNYIIKVVTEKDTFSNDLEAIKQLKEKFDLEDIRIYLMPKGIDKKTITKQSKWIIKKIAKLPYEFSSRQHILLYGNKKLV